MNETYNNQESSTSLYYNGDTAPSTSNTQTNNGNGNPTADATSPTTISNHSLNEIYLVLQQLQVQFNKFQNIHFRELLLKVNYLQDSLEHVKQLVQELNQQIIYSQQNNNNGNNNNNMMPSNNYTLNNQFKAFEVFTKHLNKLNKEIEEISSGANAQQSPPQQQHHHHHQRLPHNVSSQPPRQLHQPPPVPQQQQQQQPPQSLLPPLPSQVNQYGSSHLSVPTTNQGTNQFDEEVDNLTRKNITLRSTANASPNPTSHYVFDVGPFGSRNMNGGTPNHSLYDKPPTPPDQQHLTTTDQLHEPNRKKRKPSRKSVSHDTFRNHTTESLQQNARQSPQQQVQQQAHQSPSQTQQQQQQQQQQQVRNTSNSQAFGNTYILPMPPSTSGGTEPTSQFILPRDANGTAMTSALRQTSNPTRSSTNQPGATTSSATTAAAAAAAATAFSFDDGIESIEGLENDVLSNGSSRSSNNGSTNVIDGSSNKSKHKSDDLSNKVTVNSLDVPQYKLERSLKALADIWKEYAHGMNNKPPLKSLENKYGTKWRNETESRTFLRRKKIYEAIENGITKGYTEDQVIQQLEDHRTYRKNGSLKRKPLLWLSSNMPEKFNSPN